MTVLSAILQIVSLVASIIADAISVSVIGLVLGPMYSIAIHHTTRVLPRHLIYIYQFKSVELSPM